MNVSRLLDKTQFAGYVFIFLCMFWGLLFIYSIHSIMPYNAIKLPFQRLVKTSSFFPQGWKFFTRSPREDITDTYVKEDNNWVTTIHSNSSPINFFGASRLSRAKSVESALLLQSAAENNIDWVKCDDPLQICAEKVQSNGTVVNSSPIPYICGEVVFILQAPIPWAWSMSKKPINMPSKIIKTNVTCL
jgi:antimicrobial peptide system SdpA family protein